MLWFVYNLLFPVVFVCMLPKFISRMVRRGGYGQHFEQRLGFFGRGTQARFREQKRIWVHAVSVGEIYVALRFIKAWRETDPKAVFALSTTTSTAHAIGRRELDERDLLFYFPVDLPLIIRRVLRIVNPSRLVLVEGEYWPNLIRMADRKGIPISLINGRMSARSGKRYQLIKPLTADILRRIDPICVQGELDAERLRAIGAPEEKLHIMGTVKFDIAERDPAGEHSARNILLKLGVPADAQVLLGGSTWPGEEAMLCDLYLRLRERFKNLFLVIVPRHVERADEVIACFEERNLCYARRSRMGPQEKSPDLLLVDTTGELRNFYSVADIIFVGKSMHAHGGQNPIEPAAYGKAVVVGPNMENFPSVMPLFLEADGIRQINDEQLLEKLVRELLQNEDQRRELGQRALGVVAANRGAIQKSVNLLARE